MGKVVKLNAHEFYGPSITELVELPKVDAAKLADKVEKQKREIKALKAKNKALIRVINSPHYAHIALLNEQMRRSMRLTEECTCTPDRADFLRAIARD